MKLIPLGVNGFIPSYGRNTMSFLVLTEEHAIVLDAGTGLGRLLEPKLKKILKPYPLLNIILSHYHLDHVVGLSYLSTVFPDKSIKIFGPSAPLVEADIESAINQLLHPPLFSLRIEDFPTKVELVPVTSLQFSIGSITISVRKQNHPGGSIAIKINDSLAYLTDTIVDAESAVFARGVTFLLHELWLTDDEAKQDVDQAARHSCSSGVREIAINAGVKYLMPIHFHPKNTEAQLKKIVAELKAPNIKIILPKEGHIYNIH